MIPLALRPRISRLSLLAGLASAACGDGVGEPIRAGSVPLGGTPDAYCAGLETWPQSDVADEDRVFGALTTYRWLGIACGATMGPPSGPPSPGSPALSASAELRCSARRHARDMAERGYFSETNPEGEGPATRAALAGYRAVVVEEVIVRDQPQANQVLQGAFLGGADCDELADARLVAAGVGKYGAFWTIDLASARSP